MEYIKLTWYDEEGPFKDMDIISRSEYDLPAPYNGVGSTTMLVTISRGQWDEEKPDACFMVLRQYSGEAFWGRTFPNPENAKKVAERCMAELVQKVTGTWKPRSERESSRQGGDAP